MQEKTEKTYSLSARWGMKPKATTKIDDGFIADLNAALDDHEYDGMRLTATYDPQTSSIIVMRENQVIGFGARGVNNTEVFRSVPITEVQKDGRGTLIYMIVENSISKTAETGSRMGFSVPHHDTVH